MTDIKPLTVNQLTKYIRRKFQADPYIYQENFWLVGELTDYRPSNRHQYFALKDDEEDLPANQQYKISAVMFAHDFKKVKFQPENGMKVLVYGHVDVYPNRGSYQFYVSQMEVKGVGALQVAFQQMYEKLKAAGLFDLPKKPIPPFPEKVAIVTSNDAAVKHDMITTFRRRNPLIQLVFYPTKVQGDDAAPMIAEQIRRASQGNYDSLIVARGGGSRGDLLAFNSEDVGRAIAECKLPVISSVGHEVDTTIADLVADDREATPTSAAVKASAWVLTDVIAEIQRLKQDLYQLTRAKVDRLRDQLNSLQSNYIFQHPTRIIDQYQESVDNLQKELTAQMVDSQNIRKQHLKLLQSRLAALSPRIKLITNQERLNSLRKELVTLESSLIHHEQMTTDTLIKQLQTLNPENVFSRGYSYVTSEGSVVKDVHSVKDGQKLTIHLVNGQLEAEVIKIKIRGVNNGNN